MKYFLKNTLVLKKDFKFCELGDWLGMWSFILIFIKKGEKNIY